MLVVCWWLVVVGGLVDLVAVGVAVAAAVVPDYSNKARTRCLLCVCVAIAALSR